MNHDPRNDGYVTVGDLYAVFSKYMHFLDDKLWVEDGPVPRKVHIVEFVDNIRLALIQKAKNNFDFWIERNPTVLKRAMETARKLAIDTESVNKPDSREEYYARRDRSRGRFGSET